MCLGRRPSNSARRRASTDCTSVVGVIERDSTYSRGTLFCTLLYFGPDGSLLGKHRKLKPTAAERLIWGEGDGSHPHRRRHAAGKVGGLICWENTCRWRAWRCTPRAWRSTSRPQPTRATLAVHAPPHCARGTLLRTRLQSVRHQGSVSGRSRNRVRTVVVARTALPGRERHLFAGRRLCGGAALGSGGHSPRGPRHGRSGTGQVRLRRGRTLRAAGCVSVAGEREFAAAGGVFEPS